MNAEALRQIRGGTGPAGMLLGVDYQREPVPIRLFRTEPTYVTLVGGVWALRILVFRALALGARVLVTTADPRPWQGLGEWATGRPDRLLLGPAHHPPATSSPRTPLLVVTDGTQHDHQPPATSTLRTPPRTVNDETQPRAVTDETQPRAVTEETQAELGPWQTRITVVHELTQERANTLLGADLVMLQRLTAAEAAVARAAAGTALKLSARDASRLQEMTPEMLALLGGGANRYVWLAPTSIEQQFHGPPQR
ncbi:hypothetical protein ACQP00_05260 [Dactylosporangium sp. CS-047395]|uniref:hypothetical protein n=1 Tax=Dactylosporangium sp. CS-047395 TaxID=3239936 RepID=UPI003D9455EF